MHFFICSWPEMSLLIIRNKEVFKAGSSFWNRFIASKLGSCSFLLSRHHIWVSTTDVPSDRLTFFDPGAITIWFLGLWMNRTHSSIVSSPNFIRIRVIGGKRPCSWKYFQSLHDLLIERGTLTVFKWLNIKQRLENSTKISYGLATCVW